MKQTTTGRTDCTSPCPRQYIRIITTRLVDSHNVYTGAHLPSDCKVRKTIMPLVRRSNGRRHHWTSLTALVSKAALSIALDVHAERCSPLRGIIGRNGCAFQERWAKRQKIYSIWLFG